MHVSFENPASQTLGAAFDYQFVKMLPKIPKEFKKKTQEYLKTLEKPGVAFQNMLTQGYAPRELFYSENAGLMILFERQKPGVEQKQ